MRGMRKVDKRMYEEGCQRTEEKSQLPSDNFFLFLLLLLFSLSASPFITLSHPSPPVYFLLFSFSRSR